MGTIKRATGNDKTVGKISKSIVKKTDEGYRISKSSNKILK